jgi:Electron transfer DM13
MLRLRSLLSFALPVLALACGGASAPTAPDAVQVQPPLAGGGLTGPAVSGRLVKTGYTVTGTATLRIANGIGQLDLSSDYAIMQTPGPFLYLNTTNNPNSGSPLRIATVKNLTGAQRFTFSVPAGVDYSWVIIWCDPFNVAMAEARLAP